MQISIVHVLISIVLFFVLFFGIGFILNMLLRMTWIMAILYPIVVLLIVDEVSFTDYFTNPKESFSNLAENIFLLTPTDIIILFFGFLGAILSGYVMNLLRKKGYRMF
ncbi:YuiB family protein [Fervidibacillus halotolerans]|uniref:YuiB family protein n=1 Tax=Fervidibacillus halotolerans TaxID=2980027 RepID=A0A9E8RY58_9BACI|nr:YuiB family protein [Fervidibacillus halotolerans]WAA11883.1 YuiB family protein [Fervidibacillus halotolerans]